MNYLNPIFTEKRECQDCYKCVRNCPVKAIKVEGGYASVIAELCIVCGQCVEVCPNGAKRVRDDLPHARQLLKTREQVFVSLAPSYVSEFPKRASRSDGAGVKAARVCGRIGNRPGRATSLGTGSRAAARGRHGRRRRGQAAKFCSHRHARRSCVTAEASAG
jgi:Fe-S-cluster-containing hydrogenase component 2